MIRPMLVAVLVAGVAACASEPRREGRHRGGPPPGAARMRRALFISPSGEPFRGDGGLAAWFAQTDADHDGALTAPELQADAERFFHRLDANGDGVVDGFEITAYEQSIAPEIAAMEFDRQAGGEARPRGGGGGGMGGGGRGGGHGGGHGGMGGGRGRGGMGGGGGQASGGGGGQAPVGRDGAARYSLINEPEPVAGADENLDSRVTPEEWRHATLRRFKVLDKAKTGRLTLDALQGKAPRGK